MRIICLVKYVPSLDWLNQDNQLSKIAREHQDLILNPDDASALSFALKLKAKNPDINLEILSMGPTNIVPKLKELLKLGIDQATIISDSMYRGSDSLVTAKILTKQLATHQFDLIISGTSSLDGSTTHVPAQVAANLNLNHLNHVIDVELLEKNKFIVRVDSDSAINSYQVKLPILISFVSSQNYKLPFVKFENLELNVDQRLNIVTNQQLLFNSDKVGVLGSPTKVISTNNRLQTRKKQILISEANEGAAYLYQHLKDKGFIKP